MADVDVVGPYGERGTVPAEHVDAFVAKGGRLASPEELAKERSDAAYASQSFGEKATSIASVLGPLPFAARAAYKASQGESLAPTLPPELESYAQGVSGTLGNVPTLAMKEAVRATAGDAAASAYVKSADDAVQAHEGLHTAGTLAGFLAGGEAPGLATVGSLAERGAGSLLAGTATKGILGRALATGGEFAARGAAEGAILNGTSQITEAMLGDHEVAADKVFAAMGLGALAGGVGGGLLGGAGSLSKAGAGRALSGALGRLLPTAEGAALRAEEAAGDAAALGEKASVEAARAAQPGPLERVLGGDVQGAANDAAADQAWKAVGAGYGLQTTAYAKKAAKFLPHGTRDVGEVLIRKGILDTEGGVTDAIVNGTPAKMLPKIETELAATGTRLGELTDASGARVPASKIIGAVDEVLDKAAPGQPSLRQKAGMESTVRGVEDYKASLLDKLGVKIPTGLEEYPPELRQKIVDQALAKSTVSVQDLLGQRKALDELVYREGQFGTASPRVEELRSVRAKMEGLVIDSLDEASGKMPGELAGEYKALKKDFMALSVAKSAAEDSAARASKGSTFGLTDKIIGSAVGTASHLVGVPGLLAGPAAGLASKAIRERGNAVVAVLLSKMADMGALTRTIRAADEQIGRASKGLLAAPPKIAGPRLEAGRPIARATAAMARVAALAANPSQVADSVARQTAGISQTAPGVTAAVTQRTSQALALLQSKIPVQGDPDPLDPHPAPKMNDAEAATFLRYATYVDKPMQFFEDLERGKLTYEGAEVARELLPRAFEQLQAQTIEQIATLRASGTLIPWNQRQQLGVLLDRPLTPSQTPEHARFLQANVTPSPQDLAKAANGPAPPPTGPKRPAAMKTNQSPLDRLEGR